MSSYETSKELIKLIEKSRYKINEDESRNKLSGKYKEAYDLIALSSAWKIFKATGDRRKRYEEECFKVSEKAKAAGLLAVTRSNRAINYHLPPDLSELEKKFTC